MPLAYLVTVAIALLVWQVPPFQIAAATIEGGVTEDIPAVNQRVAELGVTFTDYLFAIGGRTAIIHGVCGTFMPLIMVASLTRYFGERRSWREGLAMWKFAIFADLSFTIPSMVSHP